MVGDSLDRDILREQEQGQPPHELEGEQEQASLHPAHGPEMLLHAGHQGVELLGPGATLVGEERLAERSKDEAVARSKLEGHHGRREG